MDIWSGIIRVKHIRMKNPKGFGGCIFSGYEIDKKGELINPSKMIVVQAGHNQLLTSEDVHIGEHWAVKGSTKIIQRKIKRFIVSEFNVFPTSLERIQESGELIVYSLTENPLFSGIGMIRARKLWNQFGEQLYKILNHGDVDILSEIIPVTVAKKLIMAWKNYDKSSIYGFLHKNNLSLALGKKLISFYGDETIERIAEDPYRLLGFGVSWKCVDKIAVNQFSVQPADPRRLTAAIEESLYRLLDSKHTAADKKMVTEELYSLLSYQGGLVEKALTQGKKNASYITTNGLFHSIGPYIMEKFIADRVIDLHKTPCSESNLFLSAMTTSRLDTLIKEFELFESKSRSFKLTKEQKTAIHSFVFNRFTICTGSAGTGKTTILKCFYYILKIVGYDQCQMALTGRAAKRMKDSTGENAYTIAGYLQKALKINRALSHTYYIIDEASMLDLPTFYKLMQSFNENCRIILIGDPNQLPPIGPGLIFHIFAESNQLNKVALHKIKRHDERTSIPTVANSIKDGIWPDLSGNGVQFIQCCPDEILDKILELYDRNNSQIISPTKNSKYGGTLIINQACQKMYTSKNQKLIIWNNDLGSFVDTGFRLDDIIMFTRNDWKRLITNGMTGKLINIYSNPITVNGSSELIVAHAEVDDDIVPIYLSDLDVKDRKLELGYAVTVHKSQGSEFHSVILPVYKSILFDRTLIYTAVTRAIKNVILIGDITIAKKAVLMEPKAINRVVGLTAFVST